MARKAKTPEVTMDESTPVVTSQGAVIDTDLLNVRKGPALSEKVLYVLMHDTVVEIVSEPNSEWYEIVTPSGHGYCMQKFIKRM